jgi:outer membrane protein OmpA-like peptidoglycan-associated protein
MKKSLFLLLMMAIVTSYSFASENEVNKTNSAAASTDLSHWSIGIKGGTNYYDIFDSPMMRDDQWHLFGGAVLEYTFNKIIGVGAEYEYNPYCSAILYNGTDLITPHAEGLTQDASLFGSLNLSNLLKPEREGFWKKTNIYANLGGGAGFYSYDTQKNPVYQGNSISPLAFVGLNAEYNLNKSWAVGLESQYRYYFDKEMGGKYSQADINQGGNVSLGLRYKFCAKAKQHVRNNEIAAVPVVAPVVEQTQPVVEPKPEPKPEPVAVKEEPKPEPKPEPVVVKEEPVVNFTFENILFKFDSSQLTDESIVIVDNLVNTLKQYKGWSKLQINGHTDNVGAAEYNQALSERRVKAVKDYIVSKGIPASNISFTGFGESKPKTTNDTKEGRQENRRVEFEVSK